MSELSKLPTTLAIPEKWQAKAIKYGSAAIGGGLIKAGIDNPELALATATVIVQFASGGLAVLAPFVISLVREKFLKRALSIF